MGALTLPAGGGVVFLDANALIYSVEQVPGYFPILQPLWAAARAGQIWLHASSLVITEVLPVPIRRADTMLLDAYERLFRARDVALQPMTDSVLYRAAELRAAHNMRTPDAIHAATALLAPRCDVFLTNDDGFRRVAGLPVVVLKDVVAGP